MVRHPPAPMASPHHSREYCVYYIGNVSWTLRGTSSLWQEKLMKSSCLTAFPSTLHTSTLPQNNILTFFFLYTSSVVSRSAWIHQLMRERIQIDKRDTKRELDVMVIAATKTTITTTIRLQFDCNSTALRPFDDLRYDRHDLLWAAALRPV